MGKLTRRSIVSNTIKLGFTTLVSKSLGLLREIFMARYFGVGPVADAFFTAFRIPNSLRKIFAEGALSAAFVPTLVQVVKRRGQEEASRLMTLSFTLIQSFLFFLCLLLSVYAHTILACVAPGWSMGGERFVMAVTLFRILIFFILFVSSSSLLAGALQAVGHFTIPAFSQIVMNVSFVLQLWFCSYYNLSAVTLSWFILGNGLVLLLMHLVMYIRKNYQVLLPTYQTWKTLWGVIGKFVPCVIGMGAIEISLFIDQAFASYLPEGSVSLLRYTYGFLRIPLGVFAVTFSTILLPYFSRISTYAPRRMSYYLLESTKLVFWVTFPAFIGMSIFSYKIFYTTLLSSKFTVEHVGQASLLLTLFLSGLFFFSLNKIVLNIYYALHQTTLPTIITVIGTGINTILNIVGIYLLGLKGIVLATVCAAGIQTVIFLVVLHYKMDVRFYGYPFLSFVYRYLVQLSIAGWLFYSLYAVSCYGIMQLSLPMQNTLLWTFGYWLWVGPLCALVALFTIFSRHWFGVRLHFLD